MRLIGFVLLCLLLLALLTCYEDVIECVQLAINALKQWLVSIQ